MAQRPACHDNLIKARAFALPTNIGEGLIILAAVLTFPVVGGQPMLRTIYVGVLMATVAIVLFVLTAPAAAAPGSAALAQACRCCFTPPTSARRSGRSRRRAVPW
jgi:hypothetical protein